MPNLPRPCEEEVEKYLEKWKHLGKYVVQEKALNKLFTTMPQNTELEEILLKVTVLNKFYSAGILDKDILSVTIHIYNLNIDERLEKGDLSLVEDISNVPYTKRYYSFASKYCSHHKNLIFPICDSYVKEVLYYYNKKEHFAKFTKTKLGEDYILFTEVLNKFMEHFGISNYTLKEIDQYLWQLGKEYFPNKY